MSEPVGRLLRQLSDEISALAESVVAATALVQGKTRDHLDIGSGSAWLYDHEHLVTNNHVVEDLADDIEARFPGCEAIEARVIGRDPLTDLAVLRVDPQATTPLTLSARGARLGELCFAFGSPLGEFPESMTMGIVSGLERSLSTGGRSAIFDVIQTDAAINPGNSGGPLVNVDGLVIGVSTAGIEGAGGISFAVPSQTVSEVVSEIIHYGAVERASLGITVAQRSVDAPMHGKALVVTAVKDHPAGEFQRGDVIIAVGERKVLTQNELLRALRRDVANRRVAVTVWRDGAEIAVDCRPRGVRT